MYYNTFVSGDFVYAYVHPVLGILYVGITNDIVRRIYQHDKSMQDNINKRYDARNILIESYVYFTNTNNRNEAELVEGYLIAKYKPRLNVNKTYPAYGIKISTENWGRYKREYELCSDEFDFDADRILGGSFLSGNSYKRDIYSDAYRKYIANLEKKIWTRDEKIKNLENLIKKMKT